MADLSGFDASKVERRQAFSVIPAGEYPAVITESVMKNTKDNNGRYLSLKLQILDGPHKNRVLFDNLNLINNGPKKAETEAIAQGTLKAIYEAVGVQKVNDSSELHNKPLRIKVAVKPDTMHGQRNTVNDYLPIHAGPAAPAIGAPTGSPPVAAGHANPFAAR